MKAYDVITNVPMMFNKALSAEDLFFFPSVISKYHDVDSGVEFEIRLCPALQNKLQSKSSSTLGETTDVDPFVPPYTPNLYVGDIKDEDGEDYVVLLNKYSVIPEHFLLVTKEFKSQSSPLMPSDLVQTYLLLAAGQKAGKNLLAFYNCGDNSGASQGHKHVQFLPVVEDGPPIERLAKSVNVETPDKPFSLTKLPYANHVFRFPSRLASSTPDKLEQVLSQSFLQLLDLVVSTIRHNPNYPSGKPSYNVLITIEHMYLIPRRSDTYTLAESGEKLNINALGFAGMVLVRSEEGLEAVKKEGLGKILQELGLESVHDLQVAGTFAEE